MGLARGSTEIGAFGRVRLSRVVCAGVAVGLVLGLLPIAAPEALAATAATASVDRTFSYRGQSHTYALTLNNSSTAGEGFASVAILRPSTSWTITSCAPAPAGWTATVNAGYCLFSSSSGASDDIAAGASETFTVTASVASGDSSETGVNWGVYADVTETFTTGDGYTTATAASTGSLAAAIYGVEITDVAVVTATSPIGGACPAANKKAPAGSTRVLVVCGRVHSSSSFTARTNRSSLMGTFVQNAGGFTGTAVSPGGGNVVLARFDTVTVTSTVGTGLSVIGVLSNQNGSMSSPSVTFGGYTTDTTPPASPSTPDLDAASDSGASSSDDITNDATPSFSGTAEPDSTVDILVDGSLKATATADGAGVYSATVSGAAALTDGNKSVRARATDPSGNVSPVSAALSIVVDTASPTAPSLGAGPAAIGSGTSPTWSFSGEANATFACELTYPDDTVTSDNNCVSPKTFNIAAGTDGRYTFRVSQKDVAGNQSPTSSDTYDLDREAPAAPNITSRPADVVGAGTVEWTFAGESGGTFECVLVRPDLSDVTDNSCTSPKSYNLSAQPDGVYTFKVRQTDAAGHQGAYATDTFELDRQAPDAPTITAQPDARSNNADAGWNFTGEPGGTFECVLVKPGNVEVTSPSCSAPTSYNLTSEVDGTYTFKVRQTDGVGNTGSYAASSFVLDRQAPSAPSITTRPANFTSNGSPSWTFTGESGATFECVLVRPDATEVSDASCSSPKSFDLATEDDGAYTFKVRQTDAAGNQGPYESDDFTLDRVPPSAPSIDTRPADVIGNPTVQWTFSGEDGATFECVLVRPDLSEVTDNSCASPKAIDLGAGVDGLYTFKVRQLDRAGQPGAYATDTFELDRTGPGTPTITLDPGPSSNDDTPSWSFSGELGTTFECLLVKPDNTQIDTPLCVSPRSYDLSAESDGSYTFKVRQFDIVGNPSPWATSTFALDRQAPAAPSITSQPRNYDDNPAPEWQFSGESGATFECVLVRPDSTETNDNPCSSPKTFDLSSEADGTYTFKVRQVDAAGNVGPYETDDYSFDRTPPRPDLQGGAPDLTNVPTHEWTFSGVPDAVFECTLIAPDESETVVPGCTSPYTVDLTDSADGTYTLSVRQFLDDNGSVPETDTFTLDRGNPSAPAITTRPSNFTSNSSPSWTFTGESGATFECVLVRPDLSEISDASCSSPKGFDLSGEGDGLYTFKVRQTDAAGNQGAYESDDFTLDRVPPSTPSIDTRPADVVSDPTVQWTFNGEDGATSECVLVRPDLSEVTDNSCASPKSYNLSAQADGVYTFKVRQTDKAGHVSAYATDSFELDRLAPGAPTITSKPDGQSNDDAPAWAFSGGTGTTFECVLVKPGNAQITTSNCASPRSYDLSAEGDGTYTFKVRQIDAVGNEGPFATSSFVLDRQAPSAPTISSRPRNQDADPTPVWKFSGESGATFECVLVRPDSTQVQVVPCSSPKTFDLSNEADGTYTFKVRQVDAAGNVSPYETDDYAFTRTLPIPDLQGDAPDLTNDPTREWTFSGVTDAVFECTLVAPDESETVADGCTSPYSVDLSDSADGTYTLSVRQFLDDNGSDPATDTFTLDRTVSAPTLSLHPGPVGKDTAPKLSFSGEDGATFECILVDPQGSETVEDDCVDPKQYSLESGDGTHEMKVRQTDAAGNTSEFASQAYKLDRVAPEAPSITSAPKKRTRDRTPVWSFTGEKGATFTCSLTSPGGATTAPESCRKQRSYSLAKVDGKYTFSVTQIDKAGNESATATHKMKLDLTKPAIKKLKVKPKKFRPTRRSKVTIKFRRSEPAKAVVMIKKGRKTLKVFKKPMSRKKVSLRWKTVYRKKVIRPARYKVIVKLRDKVGLRGKAKQTIKATR